MLTISRKKNQELVFVVRSPCEFRMMIADVMRPSCGVKLRFDAPQDVRILRSEIREIDEAARVRAVVE